MALVYIIPAPSVTRVQRATASRCGATSGGLFRLVGILDDVARHHDDAFENLAPFGFAAKQEFKIHREVLELFLLRILHDGAGTLIFFERKALLVPGNGLSLFDERGNRSE